MTHEFYSKIINEIWHLSVLLLRLPLKTHIWSHCLMKRVEQCYFKALKTSFVENKGQSGPLSADSKIQGKCQLSVKFSAICQLSVKKFWPFVSCQLTPSRPSKQVTLYDGHLSTMATFFCPRWPLYRGSTVLCSRSLYSLWTGLWSSGCFGCSNAFKC